MAVTVPSFIPIPWAQNGQTATIPQTTAEQGRASWDQGFPQVCALPLSAGGIPPNYLDFQGVFNALSSSIYYMQTGALWPWSSTLTYPLGAHVLGSDNNAYVAVQENTGQDPTTDSEHTFWKIFTIPSNYIGATASAPGTAGLVPPAAAGQQEYYLSGDGNWRAFTSGMPVGSIYIQFSGQSAPADLFGGTWSNISNSYAGLFFRAEGGAAAAFGGTQSDGAPNISGTWTSGMFNAIWNSTGAFYKHANGGKESNSNSNGTIGGFEASRSNNKYGAADEVRPVNSTIRIWKRTA